MRTPAGFLITWTCYGTWLYGDERGSVDDDHNAFGTDLLRPDERRVAALRGRLTHPPYRLTQAAREIVTQTIEEHCRRRAWELLALNVRSNHVHVVARFADVAPEVMMGEWKAWSSRRLRQRGQAADDQPVWTRHGSTRYLWSADDLEPAVAYVVEGQDAMRFGGGVMSKQRAQAR
ncbi:MAG: transposase [Phycisphaerales bacterium]|nr:transposase [Phycisphaerales bacterium]